MACYSPSLVDVDLRVPRGAAERTQAIWVPCGHCLGCRSNQAREWAARMIHESTQHPAAWFVTLTYSEEELPENGTLRPEDPRDFVKRLRRKYPARRLSYFLCGEYGEATQRPHYHAVLFGPRFRDRDLHTHRSGAPVWTSQLLDDTWGFGLTEITPLTFGGARYVAGYVTKKVRKRDVVNQYTRVDPETGELVDVEREFARMSRRPAIGKRWIERYWRDVYPRDYVVMDGQRMKPPRYYDKWLEDNHPAIAEEVRWNRYKDREVLTDAQLESMRVNHEAKNRLFLSRGGV